MASVGMWRAGGVEGGQRKQARVDAHCREQCNQVADGDRLATRRGRQPDLSPAHYIIA